jgi:hypothetical protein
METSESLKLCPGCLETGLQPVSNFYVDRHTKSGRATRCKRCTKKRVQTYWTSHIKGRGNRTASQNKPQREYRRRLRLECIMAYGGRCQCCQASELQFLCIDHVGGGGNQHRREMVGNKFHLWLKRNGYPAGYRTLCHNCNKSHGSYGYCPHTSPDNRPRQSHQLRWRNVVLDHYGRLCVCCGESRYEFLAIDHIAGGGRKHTNLIGSLYLWLIRNKFPDGYRTLCHNCNTALGLYGNCPHGSNQ